MPAASASQRRSNARSPNTRSLDVTRVRWDVIGRVAMLCVLMALVYLYLSAGVRMFSTWRQSGHDSATVAAMQREHDKLVRQHKILIKQETLEKDARALGMMKKGEQPYVISGLPDN